VLREIPRTVANPRQPPTVTVQRVDRHGRVLERPAPGPVKRFPRWSGEVEIRYVLRAARGTSRGLSSDDSRTGIDDD
jgi:hypothetical protein